MLATLPQRFDDLVVYLSKHPRVWCWHPVGDEVGERTFDRETDAGLAFKKKDGSLAFAPAKCKAANAKLSFDRTGFTVKVGILKVKYEYLP